MTNLHDTSRQAALHSAAQCAMMLHLDSYSLDAGFTFTHAEPGKTHIMRFCDDPTMIAAFVSTVYMKAAIDIAMAGLAADFLYNPGCDSNAWTSDLEWLAEQFEELEISSEPLAGDEQKNFGVFLKHGDFARKLIKEKWPTIELIANLIEAGAGSKVNIFGVYHAETYVDALFIVAEHT
jgi:hypothetical protein